MLAAGTDPDGPGEPGLLLHVEAGKRVSGSEESLRAPPGVAMPEATMNARLQQPNGQTLQERRLESSRREKNQHPL